MSPRFTTCVNPARLLCLEILAAGCPNGALVCGWTWKGWLYSSFEPINAVAPIK